MKNKKIAVLLTCYNRREKTLSCLRALYRCALPENHILDVFLVDDGSSDGTGQAINEEFPAVHVIPGNGQLYWTRGMYLAWKTASSIKCFDFYLWLNDDTYLFQNALDVLINASTAMDHKSIVVAATCSQNDGLLTYSAFKPNGTMISPTDQLEEAATFNGNCVLIPIYVYNRVGNLDPLFWHSIGDIDYGARAQKKGIQSFLAPGFLAHCEGHTSLPLWCLAEVPFWKRLASLYSPLGNSQPYYFFCYELRHFGLVLAIKHFLSIHLRVTFPKLWK